ncbi:hypothetical protein RRG08_006775, partial [Elysia crispata]
QGVEASCPPLEMMDQVPGYNNVGFEGVALPPPSYDEAIGQRPDIEVFRSTGSISAEDAREAILEHARNNCCWGTEPAKTMTINDLVSFNGYHMFKSSKLDLEVPNTASVKVSNGDIEAAFAVLVLGDARNLGMENMRQFLAVVWVDKNGECATYLQWEGQQNFVHCIQCSACNGIGRKQCHKCKGKGNLRWYIQLTVKWTNHLESHVEQRTSLPTELIREVTGEMAFEEAYPREKSMTDQGFCDSSFDKKYTMEKVLMQDKLAKYFVFGLEKHKRYAPDYPATCCCGCSIL